MFYYSNIRRILSMIVDKEWCFLGKKRDKASKL